MAKHQWFLDSSNGIDLHKYTEKLCNGPKCVVCGITICVHCYPKEGHDTDWRDLQCDGPTNEIFVVYDVDARASSFHSSKDGAQSRVRFLMQRDRERGIVRKSEYYLVEPEGLFL